MFWFLACAADPDALLRAGELEAAGAAWEKKTGQVLDLRHPAADALARRARRDPGLTMAMLADQLAGVQLLDRSPDLGRAMVDLPVDALAPLAACTPDQLKHPWRVAVGRSDTPADADPLEGGPLPWKHGVLVGTASTDEGLAALYRGLDADPPPRLTTLALDGAGSALYLYFGRRDGGWLLVSATDAEAAARYVRACPTSPAG